ncbi:MAG TPA: OsmC family protein [Gemmatimonadota bacterium]|nr:OsmC family protein [Gemmatimonadota bacterium]
MTAKSHEYAARIVWEGNLGSGTADYGGYGRHYRVEIDGRPDLAGSADPMFRGDADRHNPEDLFVAALSACHLLTYLALCARSGVRGVEYADEASGTLLLDSGGGGRFESVTLRPRIRIADGDPTLAESLHARAHELSFIAASVGIPVIVEPTIAAA